MTQLLENGNQTDRRQKMNRKSKMALIFIALAVALPALAL